VTDAIHAFPPPREIEALRVLALGLFHTATAAVASGAPATLHRALVVVRAGLNEAGQRGEGLQPLLGSAEPEARHLAALVAGVLAPALEAERLLVGAAKVRRPVKKMENHHALPLRHLS
jgi:hypothetical protein